MLSASNPTVGISRKLLAMLSNVGDLLARLLHIWPARLKEYFLVQLLLSTCQALPSSPCDTVTVTRGQLWLPTRYLLQPPRLGQSSAQRVFRILWVYNLTMWKNGFRSPSFPDDLVYSTPSAALISCKKKKKNPNVISLPSDQREAWQRERALFQGTMFWTCN